MCILVKPLNNWHLKNDEKQFRKITTVTTNDAVDTLTKRKVTPMQNVAAVIITVTYSHAYYNERGYRRVADAKTCLRQYWVTTKLNIVKLISLVCSYSSKFNHIAVIHKTIAVPVIVSGCGLWQRYTHINIYRKRPHFVCRLKCSLGS